MQYSGDTICAAEGVGCLCVWQEGRAYFYCSRSCSTEFTPCLTSSAAGIPRTNAMTALTMAGSLLRIAPLNTAFDRSVVRKANRGTLGNTVKGKMFLVQGKLLSSTDRNYIVWILMTLYQHHEECGIHQDMDVLTHRKHNCKRRLGVGEPCCSQRCPTTTFCHRLPVPIAPEDRELPLPTCARCPGKLQCATP